jgi:macrolide-specific efflux system membrane fusion protein
LINSALGVLLAGGGVWTWTLLNGGTGGTQPTSSTARTAAVAQGQVTATVTANGSVASATTMNANFVTSGTVTAIKVKLGDTVSKGQVLATVDDTETKEALTTAKENLTAAKEALTRAEDTNNADTIASAEKQVTSAKTAVTNAQRAQDGTTLKAPMAGTIVSLTGAVGSSSSSGSSGGNGSSESNAFIQIADLTKLQVTASVPEADATRLKVGQAATVTWNALTATRVEGEIASISPTSTTSGGVVSYPIVVTLSSVPDKAKLGQTVVLKVTVAEVADAIYVPAAAVKTAGGVTTVTVMENGTQTTRTVQIGLEGDSYTQITSGLTVGEQVVIATVTSNTTNFQFPGGFGGPGGGGFQRGNGGGGNGGGGRTN